MNSENQSILLFPNDMLSGHGQKIGEQTFWSAKWYASALGYKSLRTFLPIIRKAERICLQLEMPIEENFIPILHGKTKDIQLSKFACSMVALQADTRKTNVRLAQAYFLNRLQDLDSLRHYNEYINRIMEREQVAHLNAELTKRATAAGVRNYRYFQNEGYLGMYGYTMAELKFKRNLRPNDSMQDYMSIAELAANIFRISMTIERLKTLRNPSEEQAAKGHRNIGRQIRLIVKNNTGLYPENLHTNTNLTDIQARLRQSQKNLNRPS